jgi:hypothetical protein
MIDFSDIEIMNHYKGLPPEIKTRLFNDDTSEIIFSICSQNKLSLDQMNMCADEVDYLLLGMTPPENFPKKLSARLELNPDLTNRMVEELATKLFTSLKEPLKALYKITDVVFPKLTPPQTINTVIEKTFAPQIAPASTTPASSPKITIAPASSSSTSQIIKNTQPATPVTPTVPKTSEPPIQPKATPRNIPIVIEKKTPLVVEAPLQRTVVAPALSPENKPPSVASSPSTASVQSSSAIKTPTSTPLSESAPAPATSPIVPPPPLPKAPSPSIQPQKPVLTTPTPFITKIPTADIQSAAMPSAQTRHPLNWSDVLAMQHTESNEPGVVRSKLEQALNDSPQPTQADKKNIPTSYKEQDPYREPLE